MKPITNYINEEKHSEWWMVKCKLEHKTKHQTFKPGEEYEASKINDNWWLIDTVGVSKEDFSKYFDKIEKLDK